jgi:hypothetical protein
MRKKRMKNIYNTVRNGTVTVWWTGTGTWLLLSSPRFLTHHRSGVVTRPTITTLWKEVGGGDIHHPSDDLIVVKMLTRRVPLVRPNERGFFFHSGGNRIFLAIVFFSWEGLGPLTGEGRKRADQQLVLFTVIWSLAGLLLFPPSLSNIYLFIFTKCLFILFSYFIFWVFFYKCAEDFF